MNTRYSMRGGVRATSAAWLERRGSDVILRNPGNEHSVIPKMSTPQAQMNTPQAQNEHSAGPEMSNLEDVNERSADPERTQVRHGDW